MEYFTADTYKNWERIKQPYDKNGKLYTKVKTSCSRCGGTGYYAIGVENGQLKLHPAYNGICLQCEGVGYIEKEVRLYTESEYKKMMATNEANKIKREAEKEQRMRAEFAENKAKWAEKEGFSEDLKTYIVTGNSYAIKEELKSAGFRYSPILKWHRATPSNDYPTIKVDAAEVLEWSAWGNGNYHSDAQKYVQDRLDALLPASRSEWIGEEKEKIELTVIVKDIHGYESKYGYSKIYTFETPEGCILKWFTATNPAIDTEDTMIMSATVKEHSEYKGEKQTLVTRCKFKSVE